MGSSLSSRQLDAILNDIAHTASRVDLLSSELSCKIDEDVGLAYVLAHTISALAQRIGWAADLAADQSEGSTLFGDATQWMLPASYHEQPTAETIAKARNRLTVVRES